MAGSERTRGRTPQMESRLRQAAEAVGCNGEAERALSDLGAQRIDDRHIVAVLEAVKLLHEGGRETHRSLGKRVSNAARLPIKRSKLILKAFGLLQETELEGVPVG